MRRYLTAAVEQGLWSLLQLVLNLLLIRLVAPRDYGAFAFWANVGFVLSSVQSALSVTHLLVLPAGEGSSPQRARTERLMLLVSLLFWAAVGLATAAVVGLYWEDHSPMAAPAAALFLPAFLMQQYVRLLAFSRGDVTGATVQTFAVLVLTLGSVALCAAVSGLSANLVLLLMALAYGGVGVAALLLTSREQIRAARLSDLGDYIPFVKSSAWIFLGVGSTEVLARFYAFAVAAMHGPVALAALSATQLLLRPVPLLATAWSLAARNELARARDAGAARPFGRQIVAAIVAGTIVAIGWTVIVHMAWPLVAHGLYGGKYADDAWMVLLWGIAAALSLGQTAVSTGLQMLKAFKPLALSNAAAAAAAVIALVALMRIYGPGGAILGTAVGQGLELAAMGAVLIGAVRRMGRAKAG